MHNLNVNLASAASTASLNLLIDTTSTPRTPEILNSLIAMTNPMDGYGFGHAVKASKPPTNLSSDSNSSCSSLMESPTANNPPTIQQTCSQLIKAGLKLSIEQKRKLQSDGEDLLDLDRCSKRIKRNECSESEDDRIKIDGLTPEDEERRRRRRERNKIAATKCRLKKREKTANLVSESETLETQNLDLKTQLQELQNQKRGLLDMLNQHKPLCQHNISPANRSDVVYRLPSLDGHAYNPSRPASVDPVFVRTQTIEIYTRPASAGGNYPRSSPNFRTPSIIIEEVNDYQPDLINLDNPVSNPYLYNSQCHNYSNQNYNSTNGMDNGCMA